LITVDRLFLKISSLIKEPTPDIDVNNLTLSRNDLTYEYYSNFCDYIISFLRPGSAGWLSGWAKSRGQVLLG
jgi:hypothetical protein